MNCSAINRHSGVTPVCAHPTGCSPVSLGPALLSRSQLAEKPLMTPSRYAATSTKTRARSRESRLLIRTPVDKALVVHMYTSAHRTAPHSLSSSSQHPPPSTAPPVTTAPAWPRIQHLLLSSPHSHTRCYHSFHTSTSTAADQVAATRCRHRCLSCPDSARRRATTCQLSC